MSRNTGRENEQNLCKALNGKTLYTINQPHLRAFVNEIFDYRLNSNDKIICTIAPSQPIKINGKIQNINVKQDLIIMTKNMRKNISVKEGSGNSVHEESIYNFIEFLKRLGANKQVINSLLLYQWGDDTLDNSGDDRLKGKKLKEKYEAEMEIIHSFFNQHRETIIKRALTLGAYDELNSQVDYLYHGNVKDGVWCSIDYAININNKSENTMSPISVGFLNYQNQNRNTTYNLKKEKARKQIQFKWSNMEAILEKSMSLGSRINKPIKVLGSNKHGFENIDLIHNALNGEKITNLKPNLKKFIKYLFPSSPNTAIVTSEKINPMEKGSIDITVGDQTIRVLIKTGSSNSIHQEEYEEFYDFLIESFETPSEIINALKLIQWGDGTLDGSGPQENWMGANEIKKNYSKEAQECKRYINQKHVAKALLKRFLVTGKHKDTRPNEYIYFGNIKSAYWAKTEDIMDFQLRNKTKNNTPLLNIGNINFQSWGRTIKKSTGKDKRESLQIKASKLEEDIKKISKSIDKKSYYEQGEDSERNFVQKYNTDPTSFRYTINNKSILLEEASENNYAVQVKSRQHSVLTNKKENTKSDAYLISTSNPINEQLLYEKNFYITEEDIQGIDYKPVTESGVSIKREDSKRFTYAKFRRNSFEQLFNGQSELFIGALLYVNNEKDIKSNYKILDDNNISLKDLLDRLNLEEKENLLLTFREVKEYSNNKIKEIITKDEDIYNAVFFGTKIFEEPYCATYLYTTSLEHKDNLANLLFSVTTGSGRSKGDYTIIIKPK